MNNNTLNGRFLLLVLLLLPVSIFGQGVHAISSISFVFEFLLLFLAYLSPNVFPGFILIWFMLSIGTTVAYLNAFGNVQTTDAVSQIMALGFSFIYSFVIVVLVLFPTRQLRYYLYLQQLHYLHVFVFPILITGTFSFFSLIIPVGSFGNLAYSATKGFTSLKMFASIGGVDGLNFMVAWICSTIFELLELSNKIWVNTNLVEFARSRRQSNDPENPKMISPYARICSPGLILLIALFPILIYGGSKSLNNYNQFYQTEIVNNQIDASTISITCLIGDNGMKEYDQARLNGAYQYTKPPTPRPWSGLEYEEQLADIPDKQYEQMIQESYKALKNLTSKDILIWSEGLGRVTSDKEEADLLSESIVLANTSNVVFGLSYIRVYEEFQQGGAITPRANKFALVLPDGTLQWVYEKQHPIVGLEENLVRNSNVNLNKVVNLGKRYGKIGGAILWDYLFPSFIKVASEGIADIMLAPGYDFSTIGFYNMQINSYRAIENGFTLIRCVSGGVSSIHDPLGNILYQKITTKTGSGFSIDIPRIPHRFTLYYYIGDIFGWLCICLTVLIFSASLMPSRTLANLVDKIIKLFSCKK